MAAEKTGSCYIYASNEDIGNISTAWDMFQSTAIPMVAVTTPPDNARHKKIQNPIWRPETGSSYISASSQDLLKISKARYMFSNMAVPVDMCATASDDVPHQTIQYGGQKLVISVFFAAIFYFYGVERCCISLLTCSLEWPCT